MKEDIVPERQLNRDEDLAVFQQEIPTFIESQRQRGVAEFTELTPEQLVEFPSHLTHQDAGMWEYFKKYQDAAALIGHQEDLDTLVEPFREYNRTVRESDDTFRRAFARSLVEAVNAPMSYIDDYLLPKLPFFKQEIRKYAEREVLKMKRQTGATEEELQSMKSEGLTVDRSFTDSFNPNDLVIDDIMAYERVKSWMYLPLVEIEKLSDDDLKEWLSEQAEYAGRIGKNESRRMFRHAIDTKATGILGSLENIVLHPEDKDRLYAEYVAVCDTVGF